VDIDPWLVTAAVEALARCGFRPTSAEHDGAAGYLQNAPYDRVLCTCAVSRLPPAWLAQTRPGGLIVTTLNRPIGAGLVRITARGGERGEGRVLARDGRFMPLRADRLSAARGLLDAAPPTAAGGPECPATLSMWDVLDPASPFEFFAGLALPGVLGWHDPHSGEAALGHSDGSWVRQRADGDALRVSQGGPRRLWDDTEAAHEQWLRLGSPLRDSFGITVEPSGQWLWLGSPDTAEHWEL
jgi:hypothetical protein